MNFAGFSACFFAIVSTDTVTVPAAYAKSLSDVLEQQFWMLLGGHSCFVTIQKPGHTQSCTTTQNAFPL